MRKIDISVLESLTTAFNDAVQRHADSSGTNCEKLNLFRMSFIKKFTEDVWFLNDVSGQDGFHYRYGYLILRDMLEQFVEFKYITNNPYLLDEYFGLNTILYKLQDDLSLVEKEHLYGKKRYTNTRPSVASMTESINEYKFDDGRMSLYDVYCILSERCHNSYFDSLLKEILVMNHDMPNVGFAEEQSAILNSLITRVLIEYKR